MLLHIPLAEHYYVFNNAEFYGHRGEISHCQALNTGMYAAMREQKTVTWVTCGHDHNNDYYGDYDGITIGYGRKTGFTCYGPDGIQRGARVFEIT